MEEKMSALEDLGALRGFFSFKKWNVYSSSTRTKYYTTDTEINSFQSKANNVVHLQEKNISSLIIKDNKTGSDQKACIVMVNQEEFLLKYSKKMEIRRSETDIPECDKLVMNTNCDETFSKIKEKTEGSEKFKYKEITSAKPSTMVKENSFDGTSEEIESSENEEVSHEIINKKIPSTVQEWINHLPSKESTSSKENSDCRELKEESQEVPATEENSLIRAQLSREASLQSSSSLDSILDSRRPDPVEIFLSLGFGGLPGVDTENCRIPKRFLVPSKCKGGDWNEFLKRELIQAQNFECSSLGFRGLSGPSYRRPSAIVANIMEKLRERAVSQPHTRSRFSTVAKMVLNEKSVLNKLTPEFQSVLSPDNRKFLQNQTYMSANGQDASEIYHVHAPPVLQKLEYKILLHAHHSATDHPVIKPSTTYREKTIREFIESRVLNSDSKIGFGQLYSDWKGKKSPEVPRRIIFGQKSFAFAHDGEFVEVESPSAEEKATKDCPSAFGPNDSGEEPPSFPNSDVLLKLRRSSLQKQKNVEEDVDVDDDVFFVGNEENSTEPPHNGNECSKKAGKIPRRFLSSSNLKALEENNLSETIRLEVEKEIINLSQKIKSISNQDLPSVLQQVKELRSKIENGSGQESPEM